MRTHSAIEVASLAVVTLALLVACARDEPPVAQAPEIVASSPKPLAQCPRRLVFECSDGVTFAVRMAGHGLELFPPGLPPNGFIVLGQVPSDAGVRYQAGDTDFRSNGDLATLQIGRDRYADCVSNPAAAAWDSGPRDRARTH